MYSSLPSDAWNTEALDSRVRDMEWLAPRATQHQAVLAALHAVAPSILPLPFATLYRHPDAIHALLRERQDEFSATLTRLASSEEWALRVRQDRARFEASLHTLSPALAAATEALRVAPPGKASSPAEAA